MISTKTIIIEILKQEDYAPLPEEERQKIIKRIASEIYALAEKFDGFCRIILKIEIEGKCNA